MLKVEWDKWWQVLPALEARESLQLYNVLFVADAGWTIENRSDYLREWQELSEGSHVLRVPSELRPRVDDISGEIRHLFGWLQMQWGDAGSQADVAGNVGFRGEVVRAQ